MGGPLLYAFWVADCSSEAWGVGVALVQLRQDEVLMEDVLGGDV